MNNDILRMAIQAHKTVVTKDYPGHMAQLDPWILTLLTRFHAIAVAAERQHEREIDLLLDQNQALSVDGERFRWVIKNATRVDFKNKSFVKDRLFYLTLYIDKEIEKESLQ